MSNAAQKMIPRAPRYVLGADDNQLLCFSFMETQGRAAALKTSMVNLSETGVAFLIDPVLAPDLGEVIKIELPVPSADQIAWFGKVVRVEEHEPRRWWFTNAHNPSERPRALVAVRFEELPAAHRSAIRAGLEKSFLAALRAERRRRWEMWQHTLTINAPKILVWTALIATGLALLAHFLF